LKIPSNFKKIVSFASDNRLKYPKAQPKKQFFLPAAADSSLFQLRLYLPPSLIGIEIYANYRNPSATTLI
jgi:hypothetical protein